MKHYLITGGAGFIGKYLCESLILRGDKVSVLDNLSTGSGIVHPEVLFFKGSVLDSKLVQSLVKECDSVIHLAASVGVFNILEKPLDSLTNNIYGTDEVLRACLKFSKPFFLASSSEIYGKNESVPLSEESDRILGSPLLSRWSYSEAKAIDESLAIFYHLENNLEIKIARFFNTVGPGQLGTYGMVLPRFIEKALSNKPITVYGNGHQTRCFAHVKDVVRAIILIIESTKAIGEVFNIGNNKQISMLNLAEKIIHMTNSKSKIEIIPYNLAYTKGFEDMQRRVPDISKISNLLGWSPTIELDGIIKEIIDSQSV